MNNQETIIDLLKLNVGNRTRKERVQLINEEIKNFDKYGREHTYAQASIFFGMNFFEEAQSLIKEINQDGSLVYERDWNWFFNADNIPNQEAVFATKDFLESKRKNDFDSLHFFNLLFKQIDELKDNLDKPFDFVNSLKKNSLSKIQLHTLFGMILYWHGGYPVKNFNPKLNTILKLIERSFLEMYSEATPEKEFCKGDIEFKAQLKKLENEINTNLNAQLPSRPDEYQALLEHGFAFSGSKIDLIRILNALHEMKYIRDKNDLVPPKANFMKKAGDFFGLDLSKYDVDLSQAFGDGKTEKNTLIFDHMKEKTEELIRKKL